MNLNQYLRISIIPYSIAVLSSISVMLITSLLFILLDISIGIKGATAGVGIAAFILGLNISRRMLNKTVANRFPIHYIEGDSCLGKTFDDGKKVTIYSRAESKDGLFYYGYYIKNNIQIKCSGIYSEEYVKNKMTSQQII